MASRHLKIALLAGSLSVTGCTNLAPLYQQPEATIPAEIPSAPTGIAIDSPLAWDQVFLSEDLRSLIEIALEENRDLRVTAANIEIARAQYNIAQSSLLPNTSISGNLTEGGRFGGSGANTSAFRDSALFQLGVTGFELDFFSRVRNQNEAAFQSYLATVEGERAARIALIASVKCPATRPSVVWARDIWCAKLMRLMVLWGAPLIVQAFSSVCSTVQRDRPYGVRAHRPIASFIAKRFRISSPIRKTSRSLKAGLKT